MSKLLVLVMLLLFLQAGVAHADSPQLDALATRLVGYPTAVQCYPPDGERGGYVIYAAGRIGPVIYLNGSSCGAIQNVLTPGPRTDAWLHTDRAALLVGSAYLILVHEATHVILQSPDEGIVECTAFRNVWPDLSLLPLDWKVRQIAYQGAVYNHTGKATTGPLAVYRSVC